MNYSDGHIWLIILALGVGTFLKACPNKLEHSQINLISFDFSIDKLD